MAALTVLAIGAAPVAAAPPPCAPIECAATSIGMPADLLTAAYGESLHSGVVLAGEDLVLLLLDTSERLQLDAIGQPTTPAEQAAAAEIVAAHDEARAAVTAPIVASLMVCTP